MECGLGDVGGTVLTRDRSAVAGLLRVDRNSPHHSPREHSRRHGRSGDLRALLPQ